MIFDPPFAEGMLVRRYKRFLADVVTRSGATVTMHCANTGAMSGCSDPGSRVWYSTSDNPKRKYAHTLELVETAAGGLVGVNTARANALVAEGLTAGKLGLFEAGAPFRREVRIPSETGRFDFVVEENGSETFVEVKSVTLVLEGVGAFPDAVSVRARRHVEALAACAMAGRRAALVFCVQHSAIEVVRPADEIDPDYGRALRAAMRAGVEVAAFGCTLSPHKLEIGDELVVLPA
ncbi:MAG: DNA/RNA nuclease SfsA [Gammaproteobacteria bacterium]|nr:DNA/RNA nuclease SfsA [Gammaproteobacteria bacterium]